MGTRRPAEGQKSPRLGGSQHSRQLLPNSSHFGNQIALGSLSGGKIAGARLVATHTTPYPAYQRREGAMQGLALLNSASMLHQVQTAASCSGRTAPGLASRSLGLAHQARPLRASRGCTRVHAEEDERVRGLLEPPREKGSDGGGSGAQAGGGTCLRMFWPGQLLSRSSTSSGETCILGSTLRWLMRCHTWSVSPPAHPPAPHRSRGRD